MLRFGIPSAVQQSIVAIGSMAMQRLVNGFGDASIAAFTAASRINMLTFVPIFGFQAGLATFTGQNIGAGRLDRVKRGVRSTMFMAMGLTVIVCVALYLFAPSLIRMFALGGDALTRGVEMLRFYSIVFFVFSFQMVLVGALQGAGDIVIQTFATLSALGIKVVLGYLGVHFGILGYEAAWVTDPIGWIAAVSIVTIRYASGKWKTKAIVSAAPEANQELAASVSTGSET